MDQSFYPLKFKPILKERIWGGHKLKSVLNKPLQSDAIGESWEISDVEGDASIVINGFLKNESLNTLVKKYTWQLLGKKNYQRFGNKFPLLIKFIDAKEDLSIQLHPNDELAKKRHNSFGKTEMWYVMHAEKNAKLIVGFNKKVTPEEYLHHLENKTLTKILNFDVVEKGDTYFIEVGRVHAIGAGVLLAEIQQTSDITYRVYDWDRVDANGNSRELHNDLAIDAIDFNMDNDFKKAYEKKHNRSNNMVACPYFTTNFIPLNSTLEKENTKDSFMIYMCVDGNAEIEVNGGITKLNKGETVLLPAEIKHYNLISEKAELLEVYV